VAPEAVTNAQFTRTLCRVLGRPMLPPVPRFVLRLLFGSMADEMLLTSVRAVPAQLTAAGFRYRHPALEPALRAALATERPRLAA
jgi:NAD dependent epimerase/dehydratase family enzyme